MKETLHRYHSFVHNYLVENALLALVYALLLLGLVSFLYVTLTMGMAMGFVFSLIPAGIAFMVCLLRNPKLYAVFILIFSYFISGISRYVDIKPGISFDAALFSLLGLLLFYTIFQKNSWKRCRTGVLFLSGGWLAYCLLLLFNPVSASAEAWFASIRWMAVYMFVIVLITPLIVTSIKDIKWFLYILSVLTLLAVFKAMWQKYYGFDGAEKYWLYVVGGARTHIIYSGIRYFSFFTDAANFGTSMGFSAILLGISAFYMKKSVRIYFYIVVAFAIYGLLLSGTRSSLMVLFVAAAVFIILSKELKYMVIGSLGFAFVLGMLLFTNVGNSYAYIRRMRTAFDTQDASYVVRKENQKLIKKYMADRPFGVGIGLGGGKAKKYTPDAYMAQIATDSWLVQLWVETGVVGLALYLAMYISILIYGSYQCLFKIRDRLLRGINTAIVAALTGILVNSYANEIVGSFPNGILIFVSMAILFISKYIDPGITGQTAPKEA